MKKEKEHGNVADGAILTVFVLLFLSIPCYAHANLVKVPEINIRSNGNIVYKDENGSVKIYTEDIALLQEQLSSIPEDIFEPALYSRTHDWEYIDVNEISHMRQCNVCGTKITNAHKAVNQEECSFTYNNKTYDGYSFTCKCGYIWQKEKDHNYVYISFDEENHTAACALDGTKYCGGLTEYEEEHVLSAAPITDETHNVTCSSCLYKKEETCDFTEYFQDEITKEERLICECGNYIVIEKKPDPDQEHEFESEPDQERDVSISTNNLNPETQN